MSELGLSTGKKPPAPPAPPGLQRSVIGHKVVRCEKEAAGKEGRSLCGCWVMKEPCANLQASSVGGLLYCI